MMASRGETSVTLFGLLQVQVDHGSLQFGVTKQFFNRMNVDALIEQMGGETMAKGMGGETSSGE